MPRSSSESTTVQVPSSLRALLREIIDYAGLFPPARLPLEEAFDNYLRYRTEPEAWMLARFVIPVGRLDDLAVFLPTIQSTDPIPLSILGSGGENAGAFIAALRSDLVAIARSYEQFDGQLRGEVMEVRIPDSIFEEPDGTGPFVDDVRDTLASAAVTPSPTLFLEVPFREGFRRVLAQLLDALAPLSEPEVEGGVAPMGVKMRTGGLEASAIPDPRDVAYVIAACRDAGVRFKATAGLHRPMRHFDEGLETHMHGFLNLFGSATLAANLGLSEVDIERLLQEEDAARIRFTEDRLEWGSYAVGASSIEQVRQKLGISFGSCSFDEPREDLQALGLL